MRQCQSLAHLPAYQWAHESGDNATQTLYSKHCPAHANFIGLLVLRVFPQYGIFKDRQVIEQAISGGGDF